METNEPHDSDDLELALRHKPGVGIVSLVVCVLTFMVVLLTGTFAYGQMVAAAGARTLPHDRDPLYNGLITVRGATPVTSGEPAPPLGRMTEEQVDAMFDHADRFGQLSLAERGVLRHALETPGEMFEANKPAVAFTYVMSRNSSTEKWIDVDSRARLILDGNAKVVAVVRIWDPPRVVRLVPEENRDAAGKAIWLFAVGVCSSWLAMLLLFIGSVFAFMGASSYAGWHRWSAVIQLLATFVGFCGLMWFWQIIGGIDKTPLGIDLRVNQWFVMFMELVGLVVAAMTIVYPIYILRAAEFRRVREDGDPFAVKDRHWA